MSPHLSAILSHLLSCWSISQAAWCLLWWICQIWWFPQRHAREGWVIGLPPLSGLWHGQLIFGRTDFIYDGEMTAGAAGCEMADTTMAPASETRRGFKGQRERRISILFPKQLLMIFRLREVVFIRKYLISSLWYSTTMQSGDRELECYSPRQIKNDDQMIEVGLIIKPSKESILGTKWQWLDSKRNPADVTSAICTGRASRCAWAFWTRRVRDGGHASVCSA